MRGVEITQHTFKSSKASQYRVYGKPATRTSNAAYDERPCYDARIHLPYQLHPGCNEPSPQRVEACLKMSTHSHHTDPSRCVIGVQSVAYNSFHTVGRHLIEPEGAMPHP